MKQRPLAIIVTHSTRVFGPPFALVDYLKKADWDVLLIDHPLDYEPDRHSMTRFWQNGALVREKSYPNWLASRPVNYLKDFIVTLGVLICYAGRRPLAYYVGCDSLALIAGIWLRPLMGWQRLIGYNTDYSTTRFDSVLLNKIYLWADRYAMKRVTTLWCVTERIAAVRRRESQGRVEVLVVPNGVYVDKVAATGRHDQGLVFVGNLTQEKGLDLLLQAVAATPQVRLTIFGDGGERPRLENLTSQLKLTDRVTFAGQTDNQTILQRLVDFQAGVALYQQSQSYVYYSDPLKVKEYLAAGLPVIITRVPEIANQIAAQGAGVVIERTDQFKAAIETVIKNEKKMQQQARQLANQFDWDTIFSTAMSQTEGTSKGKAS